MFEDFLRALVIGFAIAAAIGPIGILCIRRSIQSGFWAGFTSGLGAAVADGTYGAVAAFGLIAVDSLSGGIGVVGRIAGGVILLWLGVSIYRTKVDMAVVPAEFKDHAKGFVAVFLLTLSNPLTIVAFVAIFAGLGVTIGSSGLDKIILIAGIFFGSTFWWVVLASTASVLGRRLDGQKIRYINITSSIGICGFGIFAMASALL